MNIDARHVMLLADLMTFKVHTTFFTPAPFSRQEFATHLAQVTSFLLVAYWV